MLQRMVQTGGPGISLGGTLGAPVAGTATPPADASGTPPEVDLNDPVAVAKAAYEKAVADAANKTGTPPVEQSPEPTGQPKVEVVPSGKDEAGAVVYDPTGDAGIDMALGFIGGLGIEGTDPAMVAAANGDFSFIKAKLATMGDAAKGWEQHVALAEQGFARQLATFKETTEKSLAACHTVAGGADQWKLIEKWAGENADPEEKAALSAMFDQGPVQARLAATAMRSAYEQAKGTTIAPANPASTASGAPPAAQTQLTRANYHKEVDALYRTMGNAMDGSTEYADLKRRYFGR
jgi:hypothetical protein